MSVSFELLATRSDRQPTMAAPLPNLAPSPGRHCWRRSTRRQDAQGMTVRVTQQHAPVPVDSPVDPRHAQTIQYLVDVLGLEPGLDVPEVFGPGVRRVGPTSRRCQIVKELQPR